jgi:NAD(P)-dependent dehydrogenase (short-subunit alcohol dehydrogenase family)
MRIAESVALVTGGSSGLGLATARRLAREGAEVLVADLNPPPTELLDAPGSRLRFVEADVVDEAGLGLALDRAVERGPLRMLVHCAGRTGSMRVLDRDGEPGSLDDYRRVIDTNLVGTFNALRLAAARMAANEPLDGDRGVCVLTASVAAWEGRVGQLPYAASKAGVVGMTSVAAHDLAGRKIRVCAIAPGYFDTPLLGSMPAETRTRLEESVPHPSRLGDPDDFALLATQIVANPMLNGETIRLDGAARLGGAR